MYIRLYSFISLSIFLDTLGRNNTMVTNIKQCHKYTTFLKNLFHNSDNPKLKKKIKEIDTNKSVPENYILPKILNEFAALAKILPDKLIKRRGINVKKKINQKNVAKLMLSDMKDNLDSIQYGN